MKKLIKTVAALLTVALLASMLPMSSLAAPAPFTDVDTSAWYYPAVRYMNVNGYMSGISDTVFDTGATTSRAMFVTILGRIQGIDVEAYKGKSTFEDVPQDWAEPYIAWASEEEIVLGVGDNKFDPTGPITREQAATILYKFLKASGQEPTVDETALDKFTDTVSISDYAKKPMQWIVSAGVVKGNGSGAVDPGSKATRVQIAQIFTQFVKHLEAVDAAGKYEAGATVEKDENSPSGYTVHFVYKSDEKNIASVSVSGPFNYIDPAKDVKAAGNTYTPYEYKAGMYPSNFSPSSGLWGYSEAMGYDPATGTYSTSFPITSGSFAYSYVIAYNDGTESKTIDDPASPSPAKLSNSKTPTGDLTHSIVYGQFDEVKQAGSPNLDYVRPVEDTAKAGKLEYLEYDGSETDTHNDAKQVVGVYLPAGYDENRAEPYKVIYTSHGGGGNETDWFAMGNVNNIMDNLGLDYVVVTMDNSYYTWDYPTIEDNVLNHIIPFIEENYNVSKDAADRAFNGLSMGSATTLHMFFDHPDKFAFFGAYSAFDPTAWKDDVEGIDKPTLYFNVGTCDFASPKLIEEGERKDELMKFVNSLKAMDNVIDGGDIPGAHDWFEWSQSFHYFASEVCWAE